MFYMRKVERILFHAPADFINRFKNKSSLIIIIIIFDPSGIDLIDLNESWFMKRKVVFVFVYFPRLTTFYSRTLLKSTPDWRFRFLPLSGFGCGFGGGSRVGFGTPPTPGRDDPSGQQDDDEDDDGRDDEEHQHQLHVLPPVRSGHLLRRVFKVLRLHTHTHTR